MHFERTGNNFDAFFYETVTILMHFGRKVNNFDAF